MKEFSFENQGTVTHLVYAISAEETVDKASLGMLTNNKIPGLAPAIFTQMDADRFIKYDVSAKISVKQFFEGQVNKKRLIGVFTGIVDALLSAEDYMIDVSTILMDLDYIFVDAATCATSLVCLPIEGEESGVDLATFFKTIMYDTRFDQSENCDYVARIMNYFNGSAVFSLVNFKTFLNSIGTNATPAEAPSNQAAAPGNPAPRPEPKPEVRQEVKPEPKPVQKPEPKPAQVVKPDPKPQSAKVVEPVPDKDTVSSEKQISLLYLMQHYSKENKALYDAQKAARKANKAAPGKAASGDPGFDIPGFDIPGNPGSASNKPMPPVETPPAKPVTPAAPPKKQQEPPVKPPVAEPAYERNISAPSGDQGASFGNTVILGGSAESDRTVMISNTQMSSGAPYLVRLRNNERISINKPVFKVGREQQSVDYVLGGEKVSRKHFQIISRDGQYFIEDTRSSNHTYVDGNMIESDKEIPLSHGAKIRVAKDEEFEFRMY